MLIGKFIQESLLVFIINIIIMNTQHKLDIDKEIE